MADDPQREYAEALAAFKTARARLAEAKRHVPPSPRDLYRQRLRDERTADAAARNTPEARAERAKWNRMLTEKMVGLLGSVTRQALDRAPIGERLIIRMPKAQD